jgi:hypothetical protein
MIDCCLTPNEQFNYIMERTSYIQRNDDDDIRCVQQSQLNLYSSMSSSSLKQQSIGRHVVPIEHIILI